MGPHDIATPQAGTSIGSKHMALCTSGYSKACFLMLTFYGYVQYACSGERLQNSTLERRPSTHTIMPHLKRFDVSLAHNRLAT